MKLRLTIAALVLIFGTAGWVNGRSPSSGALRGQQVIASGQFECDGETAEVEWINEEGRPLRIRQSEIWLGMYKGSVADLWVWLALDDGNVLGHTNWDHYADPVAPHYLRYVYAPDFIEVAQGQALILRYGCQDIGESGAVGDATVTIWYLED